MSKIQLFLWALLIFLPFSCSKDKQENGKESAAQLTNSKVLDRIKALGFKTENIVEYKDYYAVEGDIVFFKSDTVFSKLKQARTYSIVSKTRTKISVFLYQNFTENKTPLLNSKMSIALNEAITAYNNLESYIRFSRVASQDQADIIVFQDNEYVGSAFAQADFPTDGKPGPHLRISEKSIGPKLSPDNASCISQLIQLLTHELGHTIGLRHTNWLQNRENAEPYGATLIPGTDAIDIYSVMNINIFPDTVLHSWNGFSHFDSIAIVTLYDWLPRISVTETPQGVSGTVYVGGHCGSHDGQPYQMGSAPTPSIYVTKTVNGINYGGNIPFKSVSYGSFTIKCDGGARQEYTPWTATYSGIIYKLP